MEKKKPAKLPDKPDRYFPGYVYQLYSLPEQSVEETTDGTRRKRTGFEMCGPHKGLVVSSAEFNDTQSRGLIVIPLSSDDGKKPQPTWVRARVKGEVAFILCEQIRYIDRSRCGSLQGKLHEYDWNSVQKILQNLLFTEWAESKP